MHPINLLLVEKDVNLPVNKSITSSQFNSYIDNVDTDFWRELCVGEGELRHYERGEEFITAGCIGRYIGYIKSGALKYECYSEDGTPHVIGLEFAGQFVCDFPFSLYRQKSRCSIIATTPCDIYCIPSERIAEQMRHDAKLKEIIEDSTRAIFDTVYDRMKDIYCKTPQERYDDLMRRDPNLFNLFSLKDIASVLNITPTHLSRLRKKQEGVS